MDFSFSPTNFWCVTWFYTILVAMAAFFSYRKGFGDGVDATFLKLEQDGIIEFEDEEDIDPESL